MCSRGLGTSKSKMFVAPITVSTAHVKRQDKDRLAIIVSMTRYHAITRNSLVLWQCLTSDKVDAHIADPVSKICSCKRLKTLIRSLWKQANRKIQTISSMCRGAKIRERAERMTSWGKSTSHSHLFSQHCFFTLGFTCFFHSHFHHEVEAVCPQSTLCYRYSAWINSA